MENKRVMIDVDHVTVRFNLANQKVDNLKEYFVKLAKRELMFQEFLALKDVSFQVHEGEAWGLIGTNGSGKSTMLKTISRILKPYKGTVTVNGAVAPLIELGAGFDPELTARENIFLNGCVLGHSEKFMKEHFDEIVDFAELHDFLDSPINILSHSLYHIEFIYIIGSEPIDGKLHTLWVFAPTYISDYFPRIFFFSIKQSMFLKKSLYPLIFKYSSRSSPSTSCANTPSNGIPVQIVAIANTTANTRFVLRTILTSLSLYPFIVSSNNILP